MLNPRFLLLSTLLARLVLAQDAPFNTTNTGDVSACPGYNAQNVHTTSSGLTADLVLAGNACNVYGQDVKKLKLEVQYETDTRIHVKITDPAVKRYEVPDSVFPRPTSHSSSSAKKADIQFKYTASPFSFSILRSSTGETLFSTANNSIIFEPQYLRLKTSLPSNPNIYGLGEHTNPFRLNPTNTTVTLWSRDAYGIPTGTNLYGNHPIYIDHRTTGSHGVFLLNSNGMDIKLADGGLEYNVIGGVLDFYFFAGSESSPEDVVKQYAELAGTPAEVPYWSFGLHQCRFGYKDYIDVANVITNYSASEIPLETMWTDIDYMHERQVFTLDSQYFPLNRVREIVSYLHNHTQKYILMTDPAVAYLPNTGYGAYDRGAAQGVWLKNGPNSSGPQGEGNASLGLVWPGVTVYPDWFNSKTQDYWNNEFKLFYSPESGVDIDGVWIDMNEPASFCNYPCTDPFAQAKEQNLPPPRSNPPPSPDVPIFQNNSNAVVARHAEDLSYDVGVDAARVALEAATGGGFGSGGVAAGGFSKRAVGEDLSMRDLGMELERRVAPGDNLLDPAYKIQNAAGQLSSRTAFTDSLHANGLTSYDTHNLYGSLMSTATRDALIARRPGLRPLIITRSTFAGAGKHTGKWLGDNLSTWDHYRKSIAGMLGFAGVYGIPMVGSDICGFGDNTTEHLCARWATLGGFYPFMRNHNQDTSISQEFYRWPATTAAAKNVLEIRYRLLDYLFTNFHTSHLTGSPLLHPLWYKYPKDTNTYPIDLQFFFGDSILVSPVTEEESTSVEFYLPKDTFYEWGTWTVVEGTGATVKRDNVDWADIPVFVKGGSILPTREKGAMLTTELRKVDFEFVVAPIAAGRTRTASGKLYVDDGVSITPSSNTDLDLSFQEKNGKGTFEVKGHFGYKLGVKTSRVVVAGVGSAPKKVKVNGKTVGSTGVSYDATSKVLKVEVGVALDRSLKVEYE